MTRPRPATVARTAAAAASGALLALSRPPVDLGPLACIALVPLFIAWRGRSVRAAAGLAFLAGVVYYVILCSWIWYFGAIAIVPFSLAVAAYWAAAGALVGWLRTRRITSPWLTAAIWVSADAVVARWPFGGFSWGEIGYAFHDFVPGRAVASVGGVALVTFLAVALNALIADLVAHWYDDEQSIGEYLRAQVGVALVAAAAVGATITRAEPKPVGPLHVALVQGNDKNRNLTETEMQDEYLPRSHFALARQITDPVDLIVFPESSMNTVDDADPRSIPDVDAGLVDVAQRHSAWVLANATVAPFPTSDRLWNLDILFDPAGNVQGTYVKRHLVPFGERVPFRSTLDHVIGGVLQQVPRDFTPGSSRQVFDIAGLRVGTLICFESAFGYQVRPLVRDGAQVIVVSTNNRSYRRSANSAQHVAIGQMRAAETGRPLVQSAISGITAVIDADGVVQQRTRLFERTVLQTTVEATDGETPYVRYGEWATFASLALVAVAVGFGIARTARSRRTTSLESPPV